MITVPSFDNVLWRKGSRSSAATDCVEVASSEHLVGVRDSKNPNGHVMVVAPAGWSDFLVTIKSGLAYNAG
jgi:Domain of unknown function (DUF397)